MNSQQLLTLTEVADMLQVSPETVKRWTRRGDLPSVYFGYHTVRYRRSDVLAFIATA